MQLLTLSRFAPFSTSCDKGKISSLYNAPRRLLPKVFFQPKSHFCVSPLPSLAAKLKSLLLRVQDKRMKSGGDKRMKSGGDKRFEISLVV